jgi:hypothetical protein
MAVARCCLRIVSQIPEQPHLQVHIYDLKESLLSPVIVVPVSEKAAVTALAFNAKDPSLLATVDQSGSVNIWQLSAR